MKFISNNCLLLAAVVVVLLVSSGSAANLRPKGANFLLGKTDKENNLLYLKGSIPGSKNTEVLIRKSVKDINRMSIEEKIEQIEKQKKSADKKKK